MSKKIKLCITNSANQTFEMPITPSEFEFKRSSGNDKATVVNLGQIIRLANQSELGNVDLKITIPIDLSQKKHYWSADHLNWSGNEGGLSYMNLLEDIFSKHEVVRVILTNTRFNNLFVFDDFSYNLSKSGTEYEVSITLTEWRNYDPIIVKRAPLPPRPVGQPRPIVVEQPRPAPPAAVGVGSVVIVNGQLHRDSYGGGPGLTEVNAQRKINFTANGRPCPYHVTNMQGGWRGWVTADSVRAQ
ncbi:hypothetical protein PT274_01410 [Leuconostocaceae bacterium ESL0958]|nr:hypothetical protein [Leuconostocaceae bacterium ESL0958]